MRMSYRIRRVYIDFLIARLILGPNHTWIGFGGQSHRLCPDFDIDYILYHYSTKD